MSTTNHNQFLLVISKLGVGPGREVSEFSEGQILTSKSL